MKPSLCLFLALIVLQLIPVLDSTAFATPPRHPYHNCLPHNFGRYYLRRNQERWNEPNGLGEWLTRLAPRAWPGIPPTVFMGFTAGAYVYEDTGGGDNPPNSRFHEVGYFGTEAGARVHPRGVGTGRHERSPNSDPDSLLNHWMQFRSSPEVRNLLNGRSASGDHWGWSRSVEEQVAVGLTDLRWHRDQVNLRLPTSLRSHDPSTQWGVLLGFQGWSSGEAGSVRMVNRVAMCVCGNQASVFLRDIQAHGSQAGHEAAECRIPESERFARTLKCMASDIAQYGVVGPRHAHSNPAYALIRTFQKFEAGRLLEYAINPDPNSPSYRWYELPGISSEDYRDITDILARASEHGTVPAELRRRILNKQWW